MNILNFGRKGTLKKSFEYYPSSINEVEYLHKDKKKINDIHLPYDDSSNVLIKAFVKEKKDEILIRIEDSLHF